jgi:hypothetical protein
MSGSITPADRRSSLVSRTATPEVSKAKTDLLSIGIDLDDDLISRLQTNLGIERIFSVARKAATLMKDKPNMSSGGTPNIIYRNVSASSTAHTASLSPFKSLVHMDGKQSATILKELNNRSSIVEPQYRPAVDKLLETFGVMYARSPDRFVARMLGKKYKSTEKADAHAISKLVLKARYVSEEDFGTMIRRIDSTVSPPLVHSLFLLLGEDKSFAVNKKRSVVDLWAFFTLLKTASEQGRRSFDNKNSLLATDVEFWKKKNPSKPAPGSVGQSAGAPKSEFSYWMDQHVGAGDLLTAENNRRFNSEANSVSAQDRQPGTHKLQIVPQTSVAELLGNPEHKHRNDVTHGRQVMGNFVSEFVNKCDVPAALHSPLKVRTQSPKGRVRAFGTQVASKDDSTVPVSAHRRAAFSRGSGQVGAALGYEPPAVRPNTARSAHLNSDQEREGVFGVDRHPRAQSAGRLRAAPVITGVRDNDGRETVASALGFGIEDGNFPRKGLRFGHAAPTVEQTERLQRRNSFGRLSRDYCSVSVAAAMGGDREDNAGRGAFRPNEVYCRSPTAQQHDKSFS